MKILRFLPVAYLFVFSLAAGQSAAEQKILKEKQLQLEKQQQQLNEKIKLHEEKSAAENKKALKEKQRLDAEKKALADERRRMNAERLNLENEKRHIQQEKQLLADQRNIRELVISHRTAVLTADLDKMLSICSKDYSEISRDGSTRTYDDLLKMVKYYAIVRNSDDLEAVMENAMLIQGLVISDQLREKASSIKKTGQAKEAVAGIRSSFNAALSRAASLVKYITVSNITVNGDHASAVSEINDPSSTQTYPVKYELILHRGSWLIKSIR